MWDRAIVNAPEADQAAQFELMASSGVGRSAPYSPGGRWRPTRVSRSTSARPTALSRSRARTTSGCCRSSPTRPAGRRSIEPHLQNYWDTNGRGKNAWAREYAELLKASSRRIKELDPGATVVLAGLADFAWPLRPPRQDRAYDVAALNFPSTSHKVLKGVRYFRAALPRARRAGRSG